MGITDRLVTWSRVKSPWIIHFNSGACNSCDIEVLAALIPTFDVERFGILLKGTPRHADVLVATGCVTRQQGKRLKRIYEQMPEPKWVVAVGTCATSAGVFRGSYNMLGGIDQVIPVDLYIPGCPPRPEVIIEGLSRLLGEMEGSKDQRSPEKSEVAVGPPEGTAADDGAGASGDDED